MISVRPNNLSLKYRREPSSCKDLEIRKHLEKTIVNWACKFTKIEDILKLDQPPFKK